MTPLLPLVLSPSDLPLPELLAARLDGELFGIGGGFAPVDEFEQPRHRAASFGAVSPRLIAEQHTAAWIWGATSTPPARHEFCSTLDERVAHQPSPWLRVREVVLDADDVVTFGGRLVTAELRTCIDLARFSATFGAEERSIVEHLIKRCAAGMPEILRHLNRRRNLPHKALALQRLAGVRGLG